MSYLDQIDKERIPRHIAIIMDGNGRWAKQKNLDRTFGHREGLSAVRRLIEGARKAEISYLTLYTFSTENWKRPEEEIRALMQLMVKAVADETPDLIKNNIRVKTIGDVDRLPVETKKALDACLSETSACTGSTIILALSYSSKWELTEAARKLAIDVKSGKVDENSINEELFEKYLSTAEIPNPDILVRTGGEKRISNFLLWQIAYSELYFTDELWPDFNEESLYKAIVDFQQRERRFGKTSEQISEEN
jgi:undecaprenyl diphosphate synthase